MHLFLSRRKQSIVLENSQRRTETLFDAVIAIAMTMIALEINLPEQNIFNTAVLYTLFGEITIYFISFIVLASVWGVHTLIYSSYTFLGTPLDVILNIILMFIITLFPVLTKLMAALNNGFLLNLIYLGCYALMDILVIFLFVLANRKSILQRIDEFHNITGIIELCKEKVNQQTYDKIYQKLQFVEKYIDDPATFSHLYQELITTLPEPIQKQIRQQEQKGKTRYYTIILFYIVAFIAVSLAVLTMIFNPYWCYIIFVAAAFIFALCKYLLETKGGMIP